MQRQLQAVEADAALITAAVNVRYLTGLASSNAALLVPADGPAVLATDSRYSGTAASRCPDVELLIERNVGPELACLALERRMRVLAFEAQEMSVERRDELAGLDEGGLRLVPFGRVVEGLRTVKDDTEVELLRRACAVTDQAFAQVLSLLRPGVTERDFAIAIERAMVDLGADGPAFDTIVASGPNGAIPHHTPGARPFEPGDLVTIDCGARMGGYHADMTRTVAIGQPARWQRETYQLVADAQAAGIAAAVAGAAVADVDASARDVIAAAGYGDNFSHGLGHGVGLEIHEAPWIGSGKTGTLQDRVPITIEPGIYLPGAGGVRIEDTLVVRAGASAAGPAQPLTTTTKELLVL